MVCIYCSAPTRVTNSRSQARSSNIWRRRKCTSCGSVFTTYEAVSLEEAMIVQNTSHKDISPFSRDKLFISIYSSCGHRQDATLDATWLTQTAINKIIALSSDGRIDRKQIIAKVIEVLEKFDRTAATVYRAYHN